MPRGSMSPPTEFSNAVTDEINELRRVGNVTQEDIAGAIGKHQSYVSCRVNRVGLWTLNDIDLLSPLFGMTPCELLIGAERRQKEQHEAPTATTK
jgi:hypothetical protein